MKRSASETTKNGYFNLERLSLLFAWLMAENFDSGRLWNGFVSDVELFMCRTKCINYDNVFESETENVLGTAVEWLLSSASETTGVLLYIWVGPNSN